MLTLAFVAEGPLVVGPYTLTDLSVELARPVETEVDAFGDFSFDETDSVALYGRWYQDSGSGPEYMETLLLNGSDPLDGTIDLSGAPPILTLTGSYSATMGGAVAFWSSISSGML